MNIESQQTLVGPMRRVETQIDHIISRVMSSPFPLNHPNRKAGGLPNPETLKGVKSNSLGLSKRAKPQDRTPPAPTHSRFQNHTIFIRASSVSCCCFLGSTPNRSPGLYISV